MIKFTSTKVQKKFPAAEGGRTVISGRQPRGGKDEISPCKQWGELQAEPAGSVDRADEKAKTFEKCGGMKPKDGRVRRKKRRKLQCRQSRREGKL